MKIDLTCFLLLLLSLRTAGQTTFTFTTEVNRVQHDRRLIDTVITGSLNILLSSASEKEWRSAFWAMELMLYKTPQTKTKLQEAWRKADSLTEGFQKALLEVSYTLYPKAFVPVATQLLQTTVSPAVFIRCAEYLLRSKNNAATRRLIRQQLKQRFNGSAYPGFAILQKRITPDVGSKRAPVTDLFASTFLPGHTVIYSLQRSNRAFPGAVIIRKPDGSFLRNSDGSLFYTTQLARSITDYPYYITNGNTPQGIFRWTGFDTSSVSYIGPTPNLQMVMPIEASPAAFFGDSSLQPKWTKELYASLLPQTWRTEDGIYESWWAGLMGRSEIIMHGTTINSQYYKGQTYFPQTPSLGCLCSYEEWDKNGRRQTSNQQRIVEALNSIGSQSGYVVVMDIDDQQRPVSKREVELLLRDEMPKKTSGL